MSQLINILIRAARHNKIIFITLSVLFLISPSAKAQLVPDNTLGSENSTVVPVSNTRDNIEGGARRGSNLFHSFREFNVNPNREVYFNNSAGVQNIINRVTGNNISNIFGTLGVNGNANLYLINPNGIVFGDGASLDINGTFIGTTADGVRLGTNDVYSASDPASSNLLTIQPGALFVNRFRNTRSSIANQGNLAVNPGSNLTLSADEINNNGLINIPGGNVFLEAVNGDINITNIDTVDAINGGGNINISASGAITVKGKIDASGGDFDVNTKLGEIMNFSEFSANSGNIKLRAGEKIKFNNNSRLFAIGNLGGNINIETQSGLLANNALLGSSSVGNIRRGKGGDINVNARFIELNNSFLFNVTEGDADTGNITINTESLRLLDGGQIVVVTQGQGDGGSLNITAKTIELIGVDSLDGSASGLFSQSNSTVAGGNSGPISIQTDLLRIESGARISTETFGQGNGDRLNIAAKTIELIGVNPVNGIPSGLFSQSNSTLAGGNGGPISIQTDLLRVESGAQISTSTLGQGDGGSLNIAAKTIELIGVNPVNGSASGLFSVSNSSAAGGNAGPISIQTDLLRVESGAQISASTLGQGNGDRLNIAAKTIELIGVNPVNGFPSGLFSESNSTLAGGNAGPISIETDLLRVESGAQISTSTGGQGDGGNLNIAAKTIELIGVNPVNGFPSGLSSESINTAAGGNGGPISIETDLLRVESGARISTETRGLGNGDRLNIAAKTIELIGADPVNGFPSGLFSESNSTLAGGNSGPISIQTDLLRVESGAQISAATFGQGDGGNLNIAAKTIELIGVNPVNGSASGLFSVSNSTLAGGNGGPISIETDLLRVESGSRISTETRGLGNGDRLNIAAKTIELIGADPVNGFPSGLFSESNSTLAGGNGGPISIETDLLRVESGARISTETRGLGNGDRLNIAAKTIELIGVDPVNGFPSGLFSESDNRSAGGNGGPISIETDLLRVESGAQISASTLGQGDGGNLNIAAKTIELIGVNPVNGFPSGLFSVSTNTAAGGNAGPISIQTDLLRVESGALISASTLGQGNGGNLNIAAKTIELIGVNPVNGFPSGLSSESINTAAGGNGGPISIETDLLRVESGALISASTLGQGNGGNLNIAAKTIELIGVNPVNGNQSLIVTVSLGDGNAGDLNITTKNLSLADRAIISTLSGGTGISGNINIAANSLRLDRGAISTQSSRSQAGNINITSKEVLTLAGGSRITTEAGVDRIGTGTGGNITIDSPLIIALPRNNIIRADAFGGRGGDVLITTNAILGYPQFLTITASSELNIDGNISFVGLSDDINKASLLPSVPAIDAKEIIANDICEFKDDKIARGSSFTIPGKGGIITSPLQTVQRNRGIVTWSKKPRVETKIRQDFNRRSIANNPRSPKQLKPAVGWYRQSDGTVVLTANPAEVRPLDTPIDYPIGCDGVVSSQESVVSSQ